VSAGRDITSTGKKEKFTMKSPQGVFWRLLISLAFVAVAGFAANQDSKKADSKQASGPQASSSSNSADVERGRYLVEQVARCPDCHTPRDANGELNHSKWLQGAPMWIMPVRSKRMWAMHAPALAGFVFSDQQGQDILERGIGSNGIPIQPPMHIYNLHHEDAVAIIAYLRSLPSR
jgi:hypothetical protein